MSRFLNHSCVPNAIIRPYGIKKIDHNLIVSIRDINPHEEITYHYDINPNDCQNLIDCACGLTECSGKMGIKKNKLICWNCNLKGHMTKDCLKP